MEPRGGALLLGALCLGSSQAQDVALLGQVYEEVKVALLQVADEVDEEASQACMCFFARALSTERDPSVRGFPLSKLVALCSSNLFDFFRELPVKAVQLAPFLASKGTDWPTLEARNHIKELQTTLISITLLSRKYKDLMPRFVQGLLEVHQPAVLRVGWYLFLQLKAKLLSPFPDLVSCMTVLACVLNVLVAHTPQLPDAVVAQLHARPGEPLDLLQTICSELKMDHASAVLQMQSVDSLLQHMLPSFVAEWRTESRVHPGAAQVETRCSHFSGLLTDPTRLAQCNDGMDREYSAMYNKQGEIDERDFLLHDYGSQAGPPNLSPRSLHNAAKRVHLTPPGHHHHHHHGFGNGGGFALGAKQLGPGAFIASPTSALCQQPVNPFHPGGTALPPSPPPRAAADGVAAACGAPGTPVTEAMASAAWLRGFTATASATEPSPALQASLVAAGGPVLAADVARRARELAEAALPDDGGVGASASGGAAASQPFGFTHVLASLTALRRSDALKLYYLSLEAILAGELHSGEAAQKLLLGAVKFHKGLMACCLEVVAASFRMASCTLERTLDRIKLRAFDMSRIIQAFVKYLPHLPRELKRHLFAIEEKIVESQAWEPGSPLFALLAAAASTADGAAAGATASDAAMGEAGASGGSGGSSPPQQPSAGVGAKRPRRQSTNTLDSPAPSAAAGAAAAALPLALGPPALLPPGSALLQEFLAKVVRLLSFRLALLVDNLNLAPLEPRVVYSNVLQVLEHALYCQTHLYYNRHIDQIMLSALYGYCKVQKLDGVSFKDIIAQYKRQPQATQAVFRSVNLEQSNPGLVPKGQADIIAFYNQCFVPVMRPFLLQVTEQHHHHHVLGNRSPLMPPPHSAAAAAAISRPGGGLPAVTVAAPPAAIDQGQQRMRRMSCPAGLSVTFPLPATMTLTPPAASCSQQGGDASSWALPPTSLLVMRGGLLRPMGEVQLVPRAAVAPPPSSPSARAERGGGAGKLQSWRSVPASGGGGGAKAEVKVEPGGGAEAMPSGLAALLMALDTAEAQQEDKPGEAAAAKAGPAAAAAAAAPASGAANGPGAAGAGVGQISPPSDHSTAAFCSSLGQFIVQQRCVG